MTFFQKPLGATLLLGSALGTPYILFETEPGEQIRRAVAFEATSLEMTPPEITQPGNAPPERLMLESLQNPVLPPSVRLSGLDPLAPASDFQPPIDLREVLRFDIDPDFVYRRFARVSTVLSDLSLDGLRVPLVSGTQAYDVAGSLTYYFDINKTLRRIQMQGGNGRCSRADRVGGAALPTPCRAEPWGAALDDSLEQSRDEFHACGSCSGRHIGEPKREVCLLFRNQSPGRPLWAEPRSNADARPSPGGKALVIA